MTEAEFTKLLLSLRHRALAGAGRITGNESDAEDTLQEANLRWWPAIPRLGDDVTLPPYHNYFNLVRWCALDIVRARQRRQRHEETVLEQATDSEAPRPDESVADPKARPLERIAHLQFLLEKFREAVSPDDYDRWFAHYALGYEIKEIAERRGENYEFVKVRVRRAQEKWMEIVERYGMP